MDLFEAIEKRRSIRKYKRGPVADGDLKKILEAARLAPSGGNRQPWFFVVARDQQQKDALATAANNQKFVADAGAVVIVLGDSSLGPKPGTSSSRILHKQDPMIAIEHMVLASVALGYGTCWIGAFNETDIKKIVKAPEGLVVVALLPIGVADEDPPAKPRKQFKEIFFSEVFGTPLEM
jgi:nitroreductase